MPHDRDGSVDRLLRGALGPRSTPRVAGPCLDADTAAAWADDTLAGADRSAAEAHAANCARCQALLAAIAKTTPIAPTAPRWRFWSAGWLVPLTGVLASALVWSVMHSGRVAQTARPHATPVDSLASVSAPSATELKDLKKKEDRVAQNRVVSSGVKGRAAKVAEPSRPQDVGDRSKDRASLESEAAALRSADSSAARSDRDAVSPSPPAETVGVTAGVTGGWKRPRSRTLRSWPRRLRPRLVLRTVPKDKNPPRSRWPSRRSDGESDPEGVFSVQRMAAPRGRPSNLACPAHVSRSQPCHLHRRPCAGSSARVARSF